MTHSPESPNQDVSCPALDGKTFAKAAVAIRAAKHNYQQLLLTSFEGNTFRADVPTILWLKDSFVSGESTTIPDFEGYPCVVQNTAALLRKLERQRNTADAWYASAVKLAVASLSADVQTKHLAKEDHED